MKFQRWRLVGRFIVVASCLASSAQARSVADALSETAEHIGEGRVGEAIRTAEAAADEGLVHPDLSFNRGLSYLERAQTSRAEATDFGQAAAGFAEALELRPEDAEAERALSLVQRLVAEDRSHTDSSPEGSSLGLFERVLLHISPLILFVLAAIGSALLSVGLLFCSFSSETIKVTGSVMSLVGVLFLFPTSALFAARSYLFEGALVAVVISESAEVVGSGGGRLPAKLPYRQGTVLHLRQPTRGLAGLVAFAGEGYVPVARVRVLADGRP